MAILITDPELVESVSATLARLEKAEARVAELVADVERRRERERRLESERDHARQASTIDRARVVELEAALAKCARAGCPTAADSVCNHPLRNVNGTCTTCGMKVANAMLITTDPLHPNGRCTCGGEGRCAWCRAPCAHGNPRIEGCSKCEVSYDPTPEDVKASGEAWSSSEAVNRSSEEMFPCDHVGVGAGNAQLRCVKCGVPMMWQNQQIVPRPNEALTELPDLKGLETCIECGAPSAYLEPRCSAHKHEPRTQEATPSDNIWGAAHHMLRGLGVFSVERHRKLATMLQDWERERAARRTDNPLSTDESEGASRHGWDMAIDRACEEIEMRGGPKDVYQWISSLRLITTANSFVGSTDTALSLAEKVCAHREEGPPCTSCVRSCTDALLAFADELWSVQKKPARDLDYPRCDVDCSHCREWREEQKR